MQLSFSKNIILTIVAILIGLALAYILFTTFFTKIPESTSPSAQSKIQALLPYGSTLDFKTVEEHGSKTNRFPIPKVDSAQVGVFNFSQLIRK